MLDNIILPYDRLLATGTVLRARVASVQVDGVTLANGDKIAADYILIATGSSYTTLFKTAGETVDDFVKASNTVSKKLAAAKSVAIVGAGAVGTELAGEIAAAQPGKKITLICPDASLFPRYHHKLGARLRSRLEAQGVTIKFGQRALNLSHTAQPYEGSITLTDGSHIAADLIFPVIGSKPQTEILSDLPGIAFDSKGRIKTDPWLRPCDHHSIFIAGDIASVGNGMTIVAIARQNPWLIKLFKCYSPATVLNNANRINPEPRPPSCYPLGPIMAPVGFSWCSVTL